MPGVSVEEVKAMLEAGKPVQIADACPRHSCRGCRTSWTVRPGATRTSCRNSGELSKSHPVVALCVYGFHVGCETAIMLREAGFDAKYMKGGHSAWKALGGAIKPHAVGTQESAGTEVTLDA